MLARPANRITRGANLRLLPVQRRARCPGQPSFVMIAVGSECRHLSHDSSCSSSLRRSLQARPRSGESLFDGFGTSKRNLSRYATPGAATTATDVALYERMFAPFGVSMTQFKTLMAVGERVKASQGVVVMSGGALNSKVVLILKGWAVAYKHDQTEPTTEPGQMLQAEAGSSSFSDEAICQYAGKLEPQEDKQLIPGLVLPTRASVIGGSALVDRAVSNFPYPNDVVTATPMEWIEWDVEEMLRLIDAPKWRAVQASIYYSLYVDLIGTLDRDRAVAVMSRDQQKSAQPRHVKPPTGRQLLSLTAFVAVPFFGFGFADNCIMLVCGEYIDATFGTVLGLSTLAAAGLGNWVSDGVGIGIGDFIEQSAARIGLTNGNLKPAQEKLAITRFTTTFAKLLGISLGCWAGMVPLLFMNPVKSEFTREDIQIYDTIFAPNGVGMSDFERLMEKSTRKKKPPATQLVQGGEPVSVVMLLLRGEALAYPHAPENPQDEGRPHVKYVGRWNELNDQESGDVATENDAVDNDDDRWISIRGSVIGGTALAEKTATANTHQDDIYSVTAVEWIEWDLSTIQEFTSERNGIQASFYSMLFLDLVKTMQQDRPVKQELYRGMLEAVLVDDVVDEPEREFLAQTRKKLNITEEEHFAVLADLGWSRHRWEVNLAASARPAHIEMNEALHRLEKELVQVRRRMALIMQESHKSSRAIAT